MGAPAERRWRTPAALVACAALLLAWAWLASEVPLKFDDLNYLTDVLEDPSDPWYWVGHPWYMHWRPLAYLAWWALGPLVLDGTAVRVLQVGTWVGAAALVAGIGWRAGRWRGVALAALALPLCPFALETLDWKSWLTSTGGILGLCLGLWELTRGERARWWVILLAGVLCLGFKEIAAFTLGLAALLGGRGAAVRGAGAALVLGGLAAAFPAKHRLDWVVAGQGAWFYLKSWHRLVWVVPLALVSLRPRWPVWIGLVLGGIGWWVEPLGSALVLLSMGVLVRRHPGWGVAALGAWGVSLAGSQRTPAYLLEGWLVVAAILVAHPPRLRWWGWSGVAALALLGLLPWASQRPGTMAHARAQRVFLEEFRPEPAAMLYVGQMKALDLDGLVWLTLGAQVAKRPPPGTRPGQLGPRSCVWADAVPLAPGERSSDWPQPGGCRPGTGLNQAPERELRIDMK